MRRTLGSHHVAWLYGDDVAVQGLIGAGSCADVDDGAGVSERRLNAGANSRILRQLHPSAERRQAVIAFGAVECGLQTLTHLAEFVTASA